MPKRVRNYTYYASSVIAAGGLHNDQKLISIPFTGFASMELKYILWDYTIIDNSIGQPISRTASKSYCLIELYSYSGGAIQDIGNMVDSFNGTTEKSGYDIYIATPGQVQFQDLLINNSLQTNIVAANGEAFAINLRYAFTIGLIVTL